MNFKKSFGVLAFTALIVGLISSVGAFANKDLNSTKGLFLNGYDPVSYRTNKPTKGTKENTFTYKGLTVYFSEGAHQSIFKDNPEQYLPAFGGFCAYTLAKTGKRVPADPTVFRHGPGAKVYLFTKDNEKKVKAEWESAAAEIIDVAEKNWTKSR